MLTDPSDHERMVEGLRTAVELMRHPAVVPLRHELFAAGYSRVVRRLNEPGRTNELITKGLAALLDGPPSLRRVMIKRGIARGDVDEARMARRDWLERTVVDRSFGTYHPSCTCKIGRADDPGAVLDERCAVRGVDGLSVVDASIMPTLVRGNTNIPVTMLAERAADLILGAG
jgi:5-(hydroxymethyl)furfural/furfural oxidase